MADRDKKVTGPQATGPIILTVKSGEKASSDGDFACEGCGGKTFIQKEIEVPDCPTCGKTVYRMER